MFSSQQIVFLKVASSVPMHAILRLVYLSSADWFRTVPTPPFRTPESPRHGTAATRKDRRFNGAFSSIVEAKTQF